MRSIVLGLCVFGLGCNAQPLLSPTSPTTAVIGDAQTQAMRGSNLPFKASFTTTSRSEVNCPPTCPPTQMTIYATYVGNATHLGRFTAESVDIVNLLNNSATGTLDLIAANGDVLRTETEGVENSFIPPNESHVTLSATIIGGTGRFSDASGHLTIKLVQFIDFAAATASGSGTIEGHISLR